MDFLGLMGKEEEKVRNECFHLASIFILSSGNLGHLSIEVLVQCKSQKVEYNLQRKVLK